MQGRHPVGQSRKLEHVYVSPWLHSSRGTTEIAVEVTYIEQCEAHTWYTLLCRLNCKSGVAKEMNCLLSMPHLPCCVWVKVDTRRHALEHHLNSMFVKHVRETCCWVVSVMGLEGLGRCFVCCLCHSDMEASRGPRRFNNMLTYPNYNVKWSSKQ